MISVLACSLPQGQEGNAPKWFRDVQGWHVPAFGAIYRGGKSAVDGHLVDQVRSGRKQPQ
ncbi:hypothetical protein AD948_12755 [Acetobacter senegalensis]|uniref:Uncharacterized protein n=1 Tax=Acetobacter senegalensis TaxID=446692 RepID=A0A149TXZ0_9PROT|nr:hypothetical protein AD948_12755 [Acetobacter senegalensis]